MRRILTFPCCGVTLHGTLDDAPSATGLLIVSGGNEIRMGAHRGMAMLAHDIADRGYPVLRFDRRGIGDSEGENQLFTSSAPDIEAAIAVFRVTCPHITRVIAFGNCDAASALMLHQPAGLDAAVLSNIWVVEPIDDLPPAAAIKARYLERIKDPRAWVGLFTGAINLRKLVDGLLRIVKPVTPSSLAQRVADGIVAFPGPLSILLAERDATAIAFMAEWKTPMFEKARNRSGYTWRTLDSDSHSFSSEADYAVLVETLVEALAK
jgi:exosortase A-associated hydrolase 1